MSIFDGISDETQSSIGNALGAIGAGLMTGDRYTPVGPGFSQFLGNIQKGVPKEALKALLIQAGATPEQAEKYSANEKVAQLAIGQLKEQKNSATLSGLVGSMPSEDGGSAAPVSNLGMGTPGMTPPAPGGPAAGMGLNGAGALAPPTGNSAEIQSKFVDSLKAGGLTNPYGLGAVAAYAQHESRYDPNNITGSWSDPSERGQAGTSGGILSWRDDRLRNMQAATAGAKDPVAAQAQFTLNENPELTKALQNAKSPEEANALMADAWKFAGHNRPGGGEYAARLATTRSYASRMAGADGQRQTQTADASGSVPLPGGPIMPAGASGMNPRRPVQVADDENATQVLEGKMGMYPRSVYGITPETQAAAADKPEVGAQDAAFEIPPGGGRPAMPGVVPSAQTQGTPAEQTQAAGVAKQAASVLQAPPPSSNAGPTTQVAYAKRVKAWAEKAIVAAPLLGDQGKGLSDLAKSRLDEANKTISGQYGQPFTDADGNKWQVGPDNQWHSVDKAEKAPEAVRRLKDARDNWKDYNLPDPNSSDPADRAVWRNMATKALSGVTTDVTTNVGGGDEFSKKAAGANSERFDNLRKSGDTSMSALGDIKRLRLLSSAIGDPGQGAVFQKLVGPYLTTLNIDSKGLSPLQQYNSVLQKIAPQMHVAGTGSQSDVEFKGAVASLGDPTMTQTARSAIIDGLEGTHRYAIDRAKIADDALNGDITPGEASKRLKALPDPLKNFAAYKEAHPEEFPAAASSQSGNGTPSAPATKPEAQAPVMPKVETMTDRAQSIAEAKRFVSAHPDRADAAIKLLEGQGIPTDAVRAAAAEAKARRQATQR